MQNTEVTVVIPAGPPSRWPQLVRAVASARSQTHRPAEVVVVVDHDTAYFRRVRRDLAGATVIENGYAPGLAGSRDTGAFHVRTELIAFLGDDVVADPQWLARLTHAFTDPAVVGAGGGLHPDWRDGRPRWLADELMWTVAPGAESAGTGVMVAPGSGTAGMVVQRMVFREVGGFGRREASLPMRMRSLSGGRWRHVPDAVLRHDVPGNAASFRAFLRRCFRGGRAAVRPMPATVARNVGAAVRGRSVDHALRAGGAIAAMAAAGAGAMVRR
ncbi:glycosyltransferase family 2 protein [Actinoplanes sp. CA-142083]|uniref:glycosyltransferase family 2 protein n=1 Tax=Actinoplanes sp. CA-142083 TaxID=3239903 RepID=UPI003D8BF6B2